MGKVIFVAVLLFGFSSLAQLYVSPNSYVFVKNEYVFVKQDVNLENNAIIFLRNEAQLLQGTTGSSTNKGQGLLSVFQEGTSDNFDYNYWCSPVGNASTSTGNENFGITMIQLPSSVINSSPATMLTSSYDGLSSNGSLSIATYWIWKFLAGADYSEWIQSGANTDISAGQGFTMKGTSGTDNTNIGEATVNNPGGAQRYDFRGKPNDGNITVNVATDNLTLTGNPYPSALHVNAFLLDPSNTDCTGIAYYWEHDKTVDSHLLLAYRGGYGTYAPVSTSPTEYGIYVPATFDSYNIDGTINTTGASSGLSIQRKYAPIGQGFMVKGKASGSPVAVTLKNSHREFYKESDVYSEFERNVNNYIASTQSPTADQAAQIRLNTIMNNQFTRQIALVFLPTATDGIDRGIDAKSPVEETIPNDVYFFLDNNKYVIQGISFDENKRIPIGIKATDNATFKFDASMVVNFDDSQSIFMYDAQDNSYHDIKNSTYEVVLSSGVYNNRFEITFKDANLNSQSDIKSDLIISQNNASQTLTVSNPNSLDLKTVKLFDITGKQIFDQQRLGAQNTYEFSTSGMAEAVYLVEIVTNDNRKMAQKIIVSNR
ncbi:T9SS type A sorting domain-containing protein [Flavobacterium sp. J49]|uniref:T9SS type A sorting domain-containing protein n=1 Tax=Flavobacterium sp. J49 TaxID=2718534 RepID=UPI0015931946|nr:T9SS type A sorting domain-containing protein [Flavobacterium sp. J49]MBF6640489.1 T9SS type A sorting domain-containing protein [Flavobacterium sp. J49]NIC01736.1 T9SS type A sorting domain-containing protein [Flavobacterium sp. J49]